MKSKLALACLGICTLAACNAIPKETRVMLAEPVDCTSADEDVQALIAAIPSGRDRALAGVGTVTPGGVATGIVTLDWRARARVATGGLERDINNKIADIYDACGPAPDDPIA